MGIRVVKLPDIGEGVAEAEVVEWHVKVGDLVAEDQMLASVMTDKATVEIPVPCSGMVTELGAEIGQSLAVGAALVTLDVAGAGDPEPAAKKIAPMTPPPVVPPVPAPPASAPSAAPEVAPVALTAAAKTTIPLTTPTQPSMSVPLGPPRAVGEKPIASPAARRRALEAGVDLRQVRGTGPAGRIRHEDIDLFLRKGQTEAAAPKLANTSVEEIKVVGLRRRIAQKMADATRRVAHFAYVEEVDVTALENLRATLNNQAGGRAKLTLLPLLMQAVVKAVGDFPQMNAHYDDEADIIRRFGGVHIGMATQTPSGLMVPVIRHAEVRDLWGLASEVKRLSDIARDGLATRDELSGSTITITSLGALGGIVSTPVMNRPEVAIIGVNKQAIRPVWQDGQFVPRKIMNLSSSFDHRVIDGYDAARFIQSIKGFLEQPATMFIGEVMGEINTQVLIIGGGPGGYVTAIRAGQLGLDTVLVERTALGGSCLNVGCIPSKALIHAAEVYHHARELAASPSFGVSVKEPSLDFHGTIEWKDGIVVRLKAGVAGLLKRSKVKIIKGTGQILDGKTVRVETDTGTDTIRTEHLVLATGSEAVTLPALPFGGRVISSTEALSQATVPDRLVVVGAGYIGLELGIAFAKLGAKVTVVEMTDRILPLYDAELTRPVSRRLAELGVEVLTGAGARRLSSGGDALVVEGADGAVVTLPADKILIAVGRRPCISGYGLERLDLTMNGAFIRIDERCATSMRNVWAIGDVTGEPMLAHRAMAQGEMIAEIIGGHRRIFDKRAIPAVCFTDPEIVSVGLLPAEAKAAGHEVEIGQFPFQANGRAMTLRSEDGFVRVTARADTHTVLGIQAVGSGVSELSAAFTLAVEMGGRLEDVADTIHAHPTLGEAFQEACLKALGHGLHT